MTTKGNIEHEGIVKEISDDSVTIRFIAQEACGACHANSLCNLNQKNERLIEVKIDGSQQLHVGDHVNIVITSGLGTKAVLISYIFPIVILIISIIIFSYILKNELLSGLLAIIMLAVYFYFIFILEKKRKKEYLFMVEKID